MLINSACLQISNREVCVLGGNIAIYLNMKNNKVRAKKQRGEEIKARGMPVGLAAPLGIITFGSDKSVCEMLYN